MRMTALGVPPEDAVFYLASDDQRARSAAEAFFTPRGLKVRGGIKGNGWGISTWEKIGRAEEVHAKGCSEESKGEADGVFSEAVIARGWMVSSKESRLNRTRRAHPLRCKGGTERRGVTKQRELTRCATELKFGRNSAYWFGSTLPDYTRSRRCVCVTDTTDEETNGRGANPSGAGLTALDQSLSRPSPLWANYSIDTRRDVTLTSSASTYVGVCLLECIAGWPVEHPPTHGDQSLDQPTTDCKYQTKRPVIGRPTDEC
jgi:hypothetical protein